MDFDGIIILLIDGLLIYIFYKALHKPKLRDIDTELLNRIDRI